MSFYNKLIISRYIFTEPLILLKFIHLAYQMVSETMKKSAVWGGNKDFFGIQHHNITILIFFGWYYLCLVGDIFLTFKYKSYTSIFWIIVRIKLFPIMYTQLWYFQDQCIS